ncbi:hypothetical protein L210DRAFT_3552125 [Boletus edulis BED1]|uniref:Heterokaryon incompatibility domain-containing protein n=1 Tax=Boletus edulis BED1 TaxID=1328754 RepID=A0AAD4BLX4_BOLED|nr:hypothetical protein L210DRAFT_3552125 [Boletus edulis BED1]
MHINEAVFKSWRQGDLTRVEELLIADTTRPSSPLHRARALAYRALVRSRSKHWDTAIDDAKKSIEIQPSVIGYVANAVAHIGNDEHETAIRIFDLVFAHGLPSENKLLLLIKAIILFECGRHDNAILRVSDLISIVDDVSLYITVRAQMHLLLGTMSMQGGDDKRAIELFKRAQEAVPFRHDSYLTLISLIFGWDFDKLAPVIRLHLRKATYAADHAQVPRRIISRAESLSTEQENLSPPPSEKIIDTVIRGILKMSPIVLIDVKSGRLCDGSERLQMFKSDPQFKEMVSSKESDDKRTSRVVKEYFQYVMLSHVWEGKEPSFQDVNQAGSVWGLDSSPLNEKLRKFCELVRSDGYRWAWSDTCCIDKTISTVLNQSLKMMYKWYQASAATFVLLADVLSPSALGDLMESLWMTRAWTSQELLAPNVIRFYARDWKPYLGDTRPNHKESPQIMQELADAIGISCQTIIAFNPDDLSVREKLRLASMRSATVEEDIAYSMIGIFKSDIRPDYGEGDVALGHLLEEIVARSGEVALLDWNGISSSYNSCLPAALTVYNRPPRSSPPITVAEMDVRVAALRNSLSKEDAIFINERVTGLPPARFANRRLHLPCIIFPVRRLGVQDFGSALENHYRARVSVIGDVEFQTSDRFSLTEPRKLIFVHPWVRDLRDPPDGFTWRRGTANDSDNVSYVETVHSSTSTWTVHAPVPAVTIDDYTRALRLGVRLQEPFHALLLQQQPNGEFKRVAAEHEIVVPGIQSSITLAKDVHIGVVEIL